MLSILIPSIPSRFAQMQVLWDHLQSQVKDLPVEILALVDNKRRSIGKKREALVQTSIGKYVAFVDDDDWVSRDYVSSLLDGAKSDPDVITFKQISSINNESFEVTFGLSHINEEAKLKESGSYADIKRKPFHVCAWRGTVARSVLFPDASYGEDWYWCRGMLESGDINTEEHVDRVLHFYRFSTSGTEAALTFPLGYLHP